MERMTTEAMSLLEEEAELKEIVRLVGAEALSPRERLALETARSIREDFLHQNAFHKVDTFTSLLKQFEMLKTVLHFHHASRAAIEAGVETARIFKLGVREEIARAKYILEDGEKRQGAESKGSVEGGVGEIAKIRDRIDEQMKQLQSGGSGQTKGAGRTGLEAEGQGKAEPEVAEAVD